MRISAIVAVGMLASVLLIPSKPSEAKLYFDADMKYNPPADVRLHYAQSTVLFGTEIEFAAYREVFGFINAIFDEVVLANDDGVIDYRVEFQVYEPGSEEQFSQLSDPNSPFGGGNASPPGGFSTPAPGTAPLDGPQSLPTPSLQIGSDMRPVAASTPSVSLLGRRPMPSAQFQQLASAVHRANGSGGGSFGFSNGSGARGMAPTPLQSAGGGGDGGGGGGLGPGVAEDESEFEVGAILESELEYSIAQNGRLLSFSGLDVIGDIINPARNITVRQFWQSSHFLTLPEGTVHVGESWKGPWFWTIPYVGETMEIPMTYTLEGIRTDERFRVAVIAYSGLLQFDTQTMDENFDRRLESDIQGDLVVQGHVLFDIDRGIVVAVAQAIDPRRGQRLQNGEFPTGLGDGLFVILTLDRMDVRTPLGNVIDTEPIDTHRRQELQWQTLSTIE